MRTKSLEIAVSLMVKAACLALLMELCCQSVARGSEMTSHVRCRPEFDSSRRDELADHLRQITGWTELRFDAHGALHLGGADVSQNDGSPMARALLAAAVAGKNMLILQDASNRADVVFSRVVPGRWTRGIHTKPPVFVILIDFADFSRIIGDRTALAAFNVGWVVLHEIAHAVHDFDDAEQQGEVGECEGLLNRMRLECGLAQRAEYFFTFLPGLERNAFTTKFVRLAFEQQTATNKTKRYWLVWDANLVGGLQKQHRQQ